LSVQPARGALTPQGQDLSIGIDARTLPAGTYSGTVQVSCDGGACEATGRVTLTVVEDVTTPPSPVSAIPAAIAVEVPLGSNVPVAQQVRLAAATPTPASFAISSGVPWLSANGGQQGTIRTPATLAVSVDPTLLSPGKSTGEIRVSTAGALDLVIPVAVTVGSTLSFTHRIGAPNPEPACFSLSTTAGLEVSEPWLTVRPLNDRQVCVAINPADLSPGVYRGSITVPGSAGITVNLTIVPRATLTTLPAALGFRTSAVVQPPARTIQISGPDQQRVPFQISTNAAWLTSSVSQGITPAVIEVKATPTGLAPGDYEAALTLSYEGSEVPIPVTLSVLNVRLRSAPESLRFSAPSGLQSTPAQYLTFTAVDDDGTSVPVRFSAVSAPEPNDATGARWLSTRTIKPTTTGGIAVSASANGLQPGVYRAALAVVAGDATNSPLSVPIQFEVTAPSLLISPSQLPLLYQVGAPLPERTRAQVQSSDGTRVRFSSSIGINIGSPQAAGWLSIEQSGNETPGEVVVVPDPRQLAPGTYTGLVRVDASGPSFSPATLPVNLTVRERPGLLARPSSVSFSHHRSSFVPPTQLVSISGTATAFTVSRVTRFGGSWLKADLSNGVTPATLRISAEPANLAVGTYEGTVQLRCPSGGCEPIDIPVTLTITPRSTFAALPEALTLRTYAGGSRVSGEISVRSNGEALVVSAAPNGNPWLRVDPPVAVTGAVDTRSGNVLAAPVKYSVTADATSLAPGTYSNSLTFSTSGEFGMTVTVPVTLIVDGIHPAAPYLADGQGWRTQVELTNAGGDAAPFTLRFRGATGAPVEVPVKGWGLVREVTGIIPAAGRQTIETEGGSTSIVEAWAELASGRDLHALSVLYRTGTAGVVSKSALRGAPGAAGRFLVPFESSGSVSTAIALVNTDDLKHADVTVAIRDSAARNAGSQSFRIPPLGRITISPSDLPAPAAVRGVAEIVAGTPVTGAAMRFEEDGAFTLIELIQPDSLAGLDGASVAPLLDGAMWSTSLQLVGPPGQRAPVWLDFRSQSGTSIAVPFNGIGAVSEYSDVIPAGGIRQLQTQGKAASLSTAVGQLSSPGIAPAWVFLRRSTPEGLSRLTSTPLHLPNSNRTILPFDETAGSTTMVALFNRTALPVETQVFTHADDGSIVSINTLSMRAGEFRFIVLRNAFTSTANRRGTLRFSSSSIGAVGILQDADGAFALVQPVRR
jgi:hypothetical protein